MINVNHSKALSAKRAGGGITTARLRSRDGVVIATAIVRKAFSG